MAITIEDVQQEAARYSPDTVKATFARADGVHQIARNLLLRRALAKEAERDGLATQPGMIVRLQLAREKVLSDAQVQLSDGAPPEMQILEKLARADYNANPERFRVPAADQLEHLLIGSYRKDGKQLAEELLGQIRKGANFGSLALFYSDDAGTKAKRGDMGFVEKGRLRPELEAAAAALSKVGDVSDVLETDLGWHLIRLADRRPADRKPFEEVRDELIQAAARSVVEKRRTAQLARHEQDLQIDEKAVEQVMANYR